MLSIWSARYARSRYLNQKCILLFQKGLELADERDRIAIADTLHDLGSVQELLGQYEAAELYYTEMLKHAWILVHRGKAGAALNKIGRLYRSRGDSATTFTVLSRSSATKGWATTSFWIRVGPMRSITPASISRSMST